METGSRRSPAAPPASPVSAWRPKMTSLRRAAVLPTPLLLLLVGGVLALGGRPAQHRVALTPHPGHLATQSSLCALPLAFEASTTPAGGQTRFHARGGDYALTVSPSEAVLAL